MSSYRDQESVAKQFIVRKTFENDEDINPFSGLSEWVILKIHKTPRARKEHMGPYSTREVLKLIENGVVGFQDLVWKKGFKHWKAVSEVQDFETREEYKKEKLELRRNEKVPEEKIDLSKIVRHKILPLEFKEEQVPKEALGPNLAQEFAPLSLGRQRDDGQSMSWFSGFQEGALVSPSAPRTQWYREDLKHPVARRDDQIHFWVWKNAFKSIFKWSLLLLVAFLVSLILRWIPHWKAQYFPFNSPLQTQAGKRLDSSSGSYLELIPVSGKEMTFLIETDALVGERFEVQVFGTKQEKALEIYHIERPQTGFPKVQIKAPAEEVTRIVVQHGNLRYEHTLD